MSTSVDNQIDKLAHQYKRHGGKRNRDQQVQRLKTGCRWIAHHHRLTHLDQIGRRQIIDFYSSHRATLTYKTLTGYFYAFMVLWGWLGRSSEPPRPYKTTQNIRPAPSKTQDTDHCDASAMDTRTESIMNSGSLSPRHEVE